MSYDIEKNPRTKIIRDPSNPILHKICKNIKAIHSLEVKRCISTLIEELIYDYEAEGLAANQIGEPYRIFAYKNGHREIEIIINPRIIQRSKKMVESVEGCLSIPGVTRSLARSQSIFCSWQNINGLHIRGDVENMEAKIWQHEIGHLDGKTILDEKLWAIYLKEEKIKDDARRNECL